MSAQQRQYSETMSASKQYDDEEFHSAIYNEAPTQSFGSETNKNTGYQIWHNTGHTGFRPVIYKPNSGLTSLKNHRKFACLDQDYVRQEISDRPIPGYTGYIRGSQHIQGRTYGETTRRVQDVDYRDLACNSPIPSDPQHSRKISMNNNTATYVGAKNIDSRCHIPGYTGAVRHSRETFGVTFGTLSRMQLGENKTAAPGTATTAEPLFKRQYHSLEPSPLPGSVQSVKPQKLVPSHLNHVKYLAY